MKAIFSIIFLLYLFIILLFTACDHNFEEINKDPNTLVVEDVTPDLLLPSAIMTSVDAYVGPTIGLEVGNLAIQHWARVNALEVDRYLYEASFDAIWSNYYLNALPDLQKIYELGEKNGNPNYQAIALIMRSWIFSVLTDVHGDIPYRQAIQGLTNRVYFPAYDLQQDVYAGLLQDLATANGLIILDTSPVAGDILFNGDMLRWKKFANSLSLKLLMRQSGKADAKVNVGAEINKILSDPASYPVFTGKQDFAFLSYLTDINNSNPFFRLQTDRQNQFRVSKTLVDKLMEINDPRLPVYAEKPEDNTITNYIGVRNGAGGIPNRTSKVGIKFRQATSPAVLMTYAEVLFIKAEAAQKGLITENAKILYEQAITASFQQHNVSPPDNYFSQPSVAYDASKGLQQIAEQKWIALFGQGLEAWFEWRRTGFPLLQPSVNNINNDQIPVRMIYPLSEQSANQENYKAAVVRQGENTINTKVWWDK